MIRTHNMLILLLMSIQMNFFVRLSHLSIRHFLLVLHVSRLAIFDFECSLRFVQVFASTWQCAQLWQRRLGHAALLGRLWVQDGFLLRLFQDMLHPEKRAATSEST